MKQTRVTPCLTYVQPDTMASFSSCSGLKVKSRQTVFIDMNLGEADTRTVLAANPPDAALLTHYHLDHSVWARQAGDAGARVFVPEKEQAFFTGLDYVIENTAGPLGRGPEWRAFVDKTLGYRPLASFTAFDGDTLFTEFVPEMVLVETPGHSPGHTSFYFPDDRLLFSGDMGLDRFGPWYGWQDCDICEIVNSLLRLDGMDLATVLTSHGGILRGEEIRQAIQAALAMLVTREVRIRELLEDGRGEQEIVAQGVFFRKKDKVPDPMGLFLYMWDTSMFRHHRDLLEKGGLAAFFPELSAFRP